jgi:hypothetical protein
MKTFDIEVTEYSTRIVQIDANSVAEAMDIANLLYKREEIKLETEDHTRTEIDIKSLVESEALKSFLIEKATETLQVLSIDELAKVAFGSMATANIEFEKQDHR